MKNSRLFQILYFLMERQDVTASWLSEKLEVSRRTIYRDIDALSAAGIPIYCRKGKGGGIRLLEQFQLDRSLLDENEQNALLTAIKNMEAVGAIDSSALLSRLSGLFQKQPVDWVEIDFDNWGSRSAEQTCFEQCKEAIFSHSPLSFTYYNSYGEQTERTVEPVRLCYKGGNWYLYAWCRGKNAYRLFRLNRIRFLKKLPEAFLPRAIPEQGPAEDSGQPARDAGRHLLPEKEPEMIPITVRFTPAAAYRVMDFFLPEEIRFFPDGSSLVETSFPPGRWVLGFLLSFGKEACVMNPVWLRDSLRTETEKIQKCYEI